MHRVAERTRLRALLLPRAEPTFAPECSPSTGRSTRMFERSGDNLPRLDCNSAISHVALTDLFVTALGCERCFEQRTQR